VFNNVEGYSNPEVDNYLRWRVATPDSKRKEIYDKVQKILVRTCRWHGCSNCNFDITHCKIKDLVSTAIGVNDGFRDAWIDK